MSSAHLNPRRAPSLMMVRLTGPTGIEEKTSAVMKPASAASKVGGKSGILISRVRLVVILFNFTPPCAREAWSDETVNQICGEKCGQNIIKNFLAQNQNTADEQRAGDYFKKRRGRTQAESFETRITHGPDHHRRQKNQDGGEQIIPVAETFFLFVE